MAKYIVIVLSLFLASCEEFFVPDIDNQVSSLIFEGLITDQPNAQLVKITQSISYNEDSVYKKVTGFNVLIEDEFGGKIQLSEDRPGYYTSDPEVRGSIGIKYRMVAVSPNGVIYNSQWELLSAAAPVDTIFGAYAEELILRYYEAAGYVEERIPGMTVLNNLDTKGFSAFYRYEFDLVFQSTNYYPTIPFSTLVYVARPASSKYIDFISTVNGNLYNNNEIIENNVQFIPIDYMNIRVPLDSLEYDSVGNPLYEDGDIRFQPRGFLIQLNQYSLSESGFGFWDAIYKQSNSSGQVFDPVDTQIEGNITNISDSTELVFGYFGASAITQKAMYLNLTNKKISVKPAIYFPSVSSPIASYTRFDFWVD